MCVCHVQFNNWRMCIRGYNAVLMLYPSLSGAPRPPSLPSIRADDSSSRLGSSICQTLGRPQLHVYGSTSIICCASGCGVYLSERMKKTNLIKELLCSTEDVFELCQLQEVLLKGFLVGVNLL